MTLNGQKYLVDVGFGSVTPLHPIPLDNSLSDKVYHSVPGAELRLVHRPIASNTDASQRLWVLESRTTTNSKWAGCYCFDVLEWLPSDFAIINYRTSQDPTSWFTHRLVMAKVLVDEQTRTKATGTVVLNGSVFERRVVPSDRESGNHEAGPKEVVLEAKTEKERVEGLKKWFGITLDGDEARGIIGRASEISAPFSV